MEYSTVLCDQSLYSEENKILKLQGPNTQHSGKLTCHIISGGKKITQSMQEIQASITFVLAISADIQLSLPSSHNHAKYNFSINEATYTHTHFLKEGI